MRGLNPRTWSLKSSTKFTGRMSLIEREDTASGVTDAADTDDRRSHRRSLAIRAGALPGTGQERRQRGAGNHGQAARARRASFNCDLQNVELRESSYKLEWMNEPWSDVEAAGQWLLELEARFQPSLIHLNQYSHGAIPWNVPVLVVGHSCVYSWFEAVTGAPPGPEWRSYREAVRLGLQGADLV